MNVQSRISHHSLNSEITVVCSLKLFAKMLSNNRPGLYCPMPIDPERYTITHFHSLVSEGLDRRSAYMLSVMRSSERMLYTKRHYWQRRRRTVRMCVEER